MELVDNNARKLIELVRGTPLTDDEWGQVRQCTRMLMQGKRFKEASNAAGRILHNIEEHPKQSLMEAIAWLGLHKDKTPTQIADIMTVKAEQPAAQ